MTSHLAVPLFPGLHTGGVHSICGQPSGGFGEQEPSTRAVLRIPHSHRVTRQPVASQVVARRDGAPFSVDQALQTATVAENTKDRTLCMEVLLALEVPQLQKLWRSLRVNYEIRFLKLFRQACVVEDLPLEWETNQQEVLCCQIDNLYFTAKSIKGIWGGMHSVLDGAGKEVPHHMTLLFDYLLARCKAVADDKLPISCHCLIELCQAMDIVLAPQVALLFKNIILAAWGVFMRVSTHRPERAGMTTTLSTTHFISWT